MSQRGTRRYRHGPPVAPRCRGPGGWPLVMAGTKVSRRQRHRRRRAEPVPGAGAIRARTGLDHFQMR